MNTAYSMLYWGSSYPSPKEAAPPRDFNPERLPSSWSMEAPQRSINHPLTSSQTSRPSIPPRILEKHYLWYEKSNRSKGEGYGVVKEYRGDNCGGTWLPSGQGKENRNRKVSHETFSLDPGSKIDWFTRRNFQIIKDKPALTEWSRIISKKQKLLSVLNGFS